AAASEGWAGETGRLTFMAFQQLTMPSAASRAAGVERIGIGQAIDCDRFRLRTFLATLPNEELDRRAGESKLTEIAAALDGNPKAIFFERAGRHPLVGNVMASRSRMALAFGVTPQQLLAEIMRRLRLKPELIELDQAQAPVQQVVLTGTDIDLTTLPVHL